MFCDVMTTKKSLWIDNRYIISAASVHNVYSDEDTHYVSVYDLDVMDEIECEYIERDQMDATFDRMRSKYKIISLN